MKDEPMISYAVRIAFVDVGARDRFLAWLRERHVAEVCAAGAIDAEIVRLDASDALAAAVEVRYRFASRDAFARYEREEAPRLRADGLAELARLGVGGGGAVFTRTTGEIV